MWTADSVKAMLCETHSDSLHFMAPQMQPDENEDEVTPLFIYGIHKYFAEVTSFKLIKTDRRKGHVYCW